MIWSIAGGAGGMHSAPRADATPTAMHQRSDAIQSVGPDTDTPVSTDTSVEIEAGPGMVERYAPPPVVGVNRTANPFSDIKNGKSENVDVHYADKGYAAAVARTGDEGMGTTPIVESIQPMTWQKFGLETFVADSTSSVYDGGVAQIQGRPLDIQGRAEVYASKGVTPSEQARLFQYWGLTTSGQSLPSDFITPTGSSITETVHNGGDR